MAKSRDAFRTIGEVADWLDTPAHVLRFWESKFTQVKPVKRAGGRRYYRPQDMALLSGIKTLLHDDGMTIKGAQKLLRDRGVKHVAALGASPDQETPVAAPLRDITPTADVVEIAPQTAPVQTTQPDRRIPSIPSEAAARARPGHISMLLTAKPPLATHAHETLSKMMDQLTDLQRRMAAA